MGKTKGFTRAGEEWVAKRIEAIWDNLQTNHLWQRILKNTLALTFAMVLAIIPRVVEVYGKASYLGPICCVFGHPGRRFGMMAEALILVLAGTLIGIGWSMLGLYLSSLLYTSNAPACYTIRGLFLAVALMVHGFLRSHTPRLFLGLVLLVIVNVVSLTSTAVYVTRTAVTQLLYPILTAVGILILVNIVVFPEFSSDFLGTTTIETLGETVSTLRDAGIYFTGTVEESDRQDQIDEIGSTPENSSLPTVTETPEREARQDEDVSPVGKLFNLFHRRKGLGKEGSKPTVPETIKLKSLTDKKAKLRAKLAGCKAAQQECQFELAFAVLPPRDLKPISITAMSKLVANTIALIGACESKYALMGDERNEKLEGKLEKDPKANASGQRNEEGSRGRSRVDIKGKSSDEIDPNARRKSHEQREERSKSKSRFDTEKENLELIKPRKEIEFGDIELLRYLLSHISKPIADLQVKIDKSVDVVTSCMAYCYDVKKLPSGTRPPTGIQLQEIDIWVDVLITGLTDFDITSATALESAALIHDLDHPQVDVMPRMETFLISSFLLNLRQAGLYTLEMLRHARVIVEKRQTRHERRTLYAPRINWQKWLNSGGEEDSFALPENARQDARQGKSRDSPGEDDSSTTSKESLGKIDIKFCPLENEVPKQTSQAMKSNKNPFPKPLNTQKDTTIVNRIRGGLADFIEYIGASEDVSYALKLTIAVLLVTWPAFLHKWNTWYSLNRGLWAALQLVLITEVAIGTSVVTFALRAAGTILGCLWGYAAFEAHNGNRVVIIVMLVIGIIPSAYLQLGSKYVKVGMVSIISMCVVAIGTVDTVVPGSVTANFLKRFIAFLIGGVVALIVQVLLLPVKARDRLVESLAASIHQIIQMESCLAYGIESETNLIVQSQAVAARFESARGKAEGALAAAETFLPFCSSEPRIKGSFKGLALVYGEILYVLHAIVDKMDNMIHLRHEYGSGVLEELNSQVHPYRRNVAGSITLVLFAVHEALTTKLPLPQFLPSARLSHLRMVNRVREVVLEKGMGNPERQNVDSLSTDLETAMIKQVIRQKYLSWNAASAAQIEIIEYLEELIDLTKLLVGANEFRSGLLTRPTYQEYVEHGDCLDRDLAEREGKHHSNSKEDSEADEMRDTVPETTFQNKPVRLARGNTFSNNVRDNQASEKQKQVEEEELPRSLQRVRSRRIEEMSLQKSRSIDEESHRAGKSTVL
ncbi:hypothetical protein BGZ60DRAFT_382357 [Tricladium varicosporioides]|nr:hypothetical protein BGZ60DRAFT_382357 [Hymenoscyphus varicosporioides]